MDGDNFNAKNVASIAARIMSPTLKNTWTSIQKRRRPLEAAGVG
ncbi:hypothetical protein [Stenotrophomonas sp.]|nr:hypothetical protein [Stenotrophomonas sp.]